MPTSPHSKTRHIIKVFLHICNILQRADVGIGPYGNLFRQSHIPVIDGDVFFDISY